MAGGGGIVTPLNMKKKLPDLQKPPSPVDGLSILPDLLVKKIYLEAQDGGEIREGKVVYLYCECERIRQQPSSTFRLSYGKRIQL